MKAKLKVIIEQSGKFELETYKPDNEKVFYVDIFLCIGPDDNTESMNYFDLLVCTTEWLRLYKNKPEILRHTMIVDKYDFNQIKDYIIACIDECDGDSWDEIALKLSRYFFWEFEDYVPGNPNC
ncbi:Imm8 family immunity protein [Avibacterium avium]|uniref:Imm8 family immunity protein n=1 Tax=Avibacterium TaxID=292486 RepID=UPI003978D6AC